MWTRFGYERGFPRGCQFGDIDAALEFDGRSMLIEAKAFDGIGNPPPLSKGQRWNLEHEVSLGKTVFVLYGCGACNDPLFVVNMSTGERHDLRKHRKLARRQELKRLIDVAMGLREKEKELVMLEAKDL